MMNTLWEDSLFERKVESDLKDLLKTLVAFANSVRPEHVAVLLIGERDDGTIDGVTNPDNIQKKIREECDKIYPDIVWRSTVYEKDAKRCVRVEIEYSGDTPHFGGPAWIRRGSETIKASDEVFQQLIDTRSDVIRELSKWVGKNVTAGGDNNSKLWYGYPRTVFELRSVNRHWVTLAEIDGKKRVKSQPLEKIILSYDDNEDRLEIIMKD